MTNEELAVRIQNGEDQYYSELWAQSEKLLFSILSRYLKALRLPNYISGDDMRQCMYSALRKAVESYNSAKPYKFTSYLKYSVINAVKAQMPDNRFEETSANLPVIGKDGEAAEMIDFIEDETAALQFESIEICDMQRQIRQAVSALPDNLRQVIILSFFRGMTYSQMQEITGKSISKLRGDYHKAMIQLRKNKALQQLANLF